MVHGIFSATYVHATKLFSKMSGLAAAEDIMTVLREVIGGRKWRQKSQKWGRTPLYSRRAPDFDILGC